MSDHNFTSQHLSGRRERTESQLAQLPPNGEQTSGVSAEVPVERARDISPIMPPSGRALVVILDRKGRIVHFNSVCEQLTGYTSLAVMGKCFWDLLPVSDEVEPARAAFEELRSGHFPNEHQNDWTTKDGRRHRIDWSHAILPDEAGGIQYVIGTGIDVTEPEKKEQSLGIAYHKLEQRFAERSADLAQADRRLREEIEDHERAEAELKAQRLLSLRADRLRSLGEMAAGIAHELNQPLVGVRGLAEHVLIGMQRGWNLTEEKVRGKLSMIIEQADRMSHIIERVRTFARDAGKPESRPVQVNDVVQATLGMIGPQLRTRGIMLECEFVEALPPVKVNPMSLEEVVLNLVVNAADALTEKTTDEGVPSTSLRILLRTRTSRQDDEKRVQIQVIDQGVGIPEELLAKVFQPFLTTKGPDQGTGLGLAVCKYIVEQVDGTISIESTVGRGTTVTVSLPAGTENSREEP